MIRFAIFMLLTIVASSCSPSPSNHVPFTVGGQEKTAVSIVVSPDVTSEQLKDLVFAFKTARENGTLSKMIPPTTKGGAIGDFGIVWVFVFSEPDRASADDLGRFIDGSDAHFSQEYVKHIRAEYYYSLSGEYGNLGFNDGTNSNNEYNKIF
jgi:hypothetical protein